MGGIAKWELREQFSGGGSFISEIEGGKCSVEFVEYSLFYCIIGVEAIKVELRAMKSTKSTALPM